MIKRCFCLCAALGILVSAPLFAQLPPAPATVGIYFDEAGTQTVVSSFPPGLPVLECWVIVYWEASVGGASYAINPLPADVSLVHEHFHWGVGVGSAFDGTGVEVGLYFPGFGFGGTPVLISHIGLLNTGPGGRNLDLCILPHAAYGEVVVADNLANLFSAEGGCGVVPTEADSWGAVKNMYR